MGTSRIVKIILSGKQTENLDLLLERYGSKAPSYFKHLLDNAFSKEFGGYKSKEKVSLPSEEDLMTVAQYCEFKGGIVTVGESTGREQCYFIGGTNKITGKSWGRGIPFTKKDIDKYLKSPDE